MMVKDGDWTLIDYDFATKRQVWAMHDAAGNIVTRTDYVVDATIDANRAQRNMAKPGWAGDMHHVASVPLNIYYDQLAAASQQGDERYTNKWLNDADNRAWRVKDGVL